MRAEGEGGAGESAWRSYAPAVVCALAGAAVFQFFGNANRGYIDTASLFYWWGFQWFNADSETQHGVLILALSAWLLMRNLRRGRSLLAGDQREVQRTHRSEHGRRWDRLQAGSHAGGWAMAGGLALHAVSFAAQQARGSIGALLLFAWGAVALAGGRRWARAAAFPLAFMIFAVPVNVLDSVGFWLRLWVIDATEAIAHAAGIGVVRSGTQLFAADGSYQYDVAAACSGVRSLMALAALTLLLGYLNFRGWGRRLAILALCFPLTYVGNVARIAGIVFAGEWWGQRAGETVHTWAGFLVFPIVLGGAMGAVRLWERWRPEKPVVHPLEKKEEFFTPRSRRGAKNRFSFFAFLSDLGVEKSVRWRSRTAVAVIVVGLAGAEMIFLGWLRGLPPRGEVGVRLAADGVNPAELPTFLGREWIGQDTPVTKIEREILPADTGFSRKLYVANSDPARQVFLSVVLSGRDRTSIHRPELCLVGQGLTIESAARQEFDFPGGKGAGFAATLLRGHRDVVTARGRVREAELVVYWFVGGDGVEPTQARRLARDAWNRVVHARTDRWAYILVQTSAADGEAAALARMRTVLAGTLPVLQKARGAH